MPESILESRLRLYAASSPAEEEAALKEIMQELILCGLAEAGLFERAVFQGGTALRLLWSLPRFSEDLDFILKEPDPSFRWEPYFRKVEELLRRFGVHPEPPAATQKEGVIQKTFFKDESLPALLNLHFPRQGGRKLKVKLEADTLPPQGSRTELKFADFPYAYGLQVQELESGMAQKCHALLCRPFIKGRDWFDFQWYAARGCRPDLKLLENALSQAGPWKAKAPAVTPAWFKAAMKDRIRSMNWSEVKRDVEPFLRQEQRRGLEAWGEAYFLGQLDKIGS